MNKIMKNVVTGILLQVSVAVVGILIPKLVMLYYGSTMNGLVTSINQLISYLALVESGIGAVGIVALYAPLANNDQKQINATVSAVGRLYRKSGLIYLAVVIVAGFVYPYMVMGQVDNTLVTSLFFVLSASNLIDYLFLGKYKTLLTADEKLYIVNIFQIVVNLLNALLSCICIINGFSLLFVKSINVVLGVLRLMLIYIYVKKQYPQLSLDEKPDYSKLGERWDSLAHQLAAIVVGNTDVLLLTVMMGATSLLEVSVYSTYNMVLVTLGGLFSTLASALQAHFGKLLLLDKKTLVRHYSIMESLVFMVVAGIYACTGALILDFVVLYTEGVQDVDYYRPLVALLFVINGFLQNIRLPGITMICAAGKYKETRNRAILEAVINLSVSIMLIPKWGILGALVGTSASYLYRTVDVIFYSHKLVEGHEFRQTGKSLVMSCIGSILALVLMFEVNKLIGISDWIHWVGVAIVDVLIVFVVMVASFILFNKEVIPALIAHLNAFKEERK